jgi:hypothetical protein
MNNMKKTTPLLLIFTLISFLTYSQKRIIKDSTEIISKLIDSEYVPYEKISFNNGKITPDMDWASVKKIFKPKKEKCKIIDEMGEFDTYCYYLGENKTRMGGSLNIVKINDNLITLDFYKELFCGAPASNIKRYFPNSYKYMFEKEVAQSIKEKRDWYLLLISVEVDKGDYPDNMGYMNMGIEIDLKSMKIKSFEFFDLDK